MALSMIKLKFARIITKIYRSGIPVWEVQRDSQGIIQEIWLEEKSYSLFKENGRGRGRMENVEKGNVAVTKVWNTSD